MPHRELQDDYLQTIASVDHAIGPAKMGMDAGPRPIPRPDDQPGAHRVEQDIADCCSDMRLVHRHAPKATSPEMAGSLQSGMNAPSIATMNGGERASQAIGITGVQDQVDMVRHENPRPDRNFGRGAMFSQQVAVGRAVGLIEERLRPAVDTLRDAMRMSREYRARHPCHREA